MKFEQMNLIRPILRAIREVGYIEPTPIQQKTVPPVLQGKDVLGCAQTGTGKTAAFEHIAELLPLRRGSGGGIACGHVLLDLLEQNRTDECARLPTEPVLNHVQHLRGTVDPTTTDHGSSIAQHKE